MLCSLQEQLQVLALEEADGRHEAQFLSTALRSLNRVIEFHIAQALEEELRLVPAMVGYSAYSSEYESGPDDDDVPLRHSCYMVYSVRDAPPQSAHATPPARHSPDPGSLEHLTRPRVQASYRTWLEERLQEAEADVFKDLHHHHWAPSWHRHTVRCLSSALLVMDECIPHPLPVLDESPATDTAPHASASSNGNSAASLSAQSPSNNGHPDPRFLAPTSK